MNEEILQLAAQLGITTEEATELYNYIAMGEYDGNN